MRPLPPWLEPTSSFTTSTEEKKRKEEKDLIMERQSGQIKTCVAGSGPQPSNYFDRRSLPNFHLLQKP
jgi:hypothetical protein